MIVIVTVLQEITRAVIHRSMSRSNLVRVQAKTGSLAETMTVAQGRLSRTDLASSRHLELAGLIPLPLAGTPCRANVSPGALPDRVGLIGLTSRRY